MPETTAKELAILINGRLKGDPETLVNGISTLKAAGGAEVAVLRDKSFRETASSSNAAALVADELIEGYEGAHIIVEDPERALARLLELFSEEKFPFPEGISDDARISTSATIGDGVSVGHFSVIEKGARIGSGCIIFPLAYIGRDVCIGENTVIYPHATIMDSVKIGVNCRIGPNAVVGDEGFGFMRRDGAAHRLRHVGSVDIGDNAEVGGLSSIDRGMLEDTVVGDGCKIDKHCMIAHNCKVGKNCLLAGYTRMAGSVKVGDGAVLAADVRVADHKEIGENAVMAAGTGVSRDIKAGEVVWGMPPRGIKTQTKIHALEGRLPDLFRRVRELEKKLEELDLFGA